MKKIVISVLTSLALCCAAVRPFQSSICASTEGGTTEIGNISNFIIPNEAEIGTTLSVADTGVIVVKMNWKNKYYNQAKGTLFYDSQFYEIDEYVPYHYSEQEYYCLSPNLSYNDTKNMNELSLNPNFHVTYPTDRSKDDFIYTAILTPKYNRTGTNMIIVNGTKYYPQDISYEIVEPEPESEPIINEVDRYDVNGDGNVNAADLTALIKVLVD